ncbi:MAG TPA: hypothetical protein VK783_03580 [Bacteroidia bacterium]|jgi:hypothetical protein|nr:hypothetical protein [Bacteroidia bacterium]
MEPTKNHIQQTMESLDGMAQATANPFLFDKVMNRMRNVEQGQLVKPATLRVAFAIAVIVIGVNVFSLLHFNSNSSARQSNAFQREYFSYITNF